MFRGKSKISPNVKRRGIENGAKAGLKPGSQNPTSKWVSMTSSSIRTRARSTGSLGNNAGSGHLSSMYWQIIVESNTCPRAIAKFWLNRRDEVVGKTKRDKSDQRFFVPRSTCSLVLGAYLDIAVDEGGNLCARVCFHEFSFCTACADSSGQGCFKGLALFPQRDLDFLRVRRKGMVVDAEGRRHDRLWLWVFSENCIPSGLREKGGVRRRTVNRIFPPSD